jgi:hypothetical protein
MYHFWRPCATAVSGTAREAGLVPPDHLLDLCGGMGAEVFPAHDLRGQARLHGYWRKNPSSGIADYRAGVLSGDDFKQAGFGRRLHVAGKVLIQYRADDGRRGRGVGLRFPQNEDPVFAVTVVPEDGHAPGAWLRGDLWSELPGDCLGDASLPGAQREPDQPYVDDRLPSPRGRGRAVSRTRTPRPWTRTTGQHDEGWSRRNATIPPASFLTDRDQAEGPSPRPDPPIGTLSRSGRRRPMPLTNDRSVRLFPAVWRAV